MMWKGRVAVLGVAAAGLSLVGRLPGMDRLGASRWALALFARALSDSQGGDGGALYVRTRWLDDGGEIYELNPEAPLYNKAISDGMMPKTIIVPGKRGRAHREG